MSRIYLSAKNPDHEVVIGLDHTMGWFFQVFDIKAEQETGEEVLTEDCGSTFTAAFGQGRMIEMIEKYAALDERTQHCIRMIAMDLDPAIGL